MSNLFQAKQVSKFLAAYVALSNQNVSSAATLNVTSPLTTALATAGNNGTSVPLNANGAYNTEGVICNSTSYCPVAAYPSNEAIEIDGFTVYGIITFATSVYTVSFYYNDASGMQHAATLNQAVNIGIPYSFSFNDYPFNALFSNLAGGSAGFPGSSGTFYYDAGVTCTSTNTLSNLTKLPINTSAVVLFVNGQAMRNGTDFTVSGQTLTWTSANAGFSLATTDNIGAIYAY
jgi:hypothetical protein